MLTVAADDAINAPMLTGRPSVARAALALGLGTIAACGASGGTPDEELPGLVHAAKEAAPAIDVARAAKDPAMLAAAIAMPEHRVTAALGPHTLTTAARVEVSDGGAVIDALTDNLTFDDGGEDLFHATENNSADYGREVIASGGQVFLRPRYARWHARTPEDGELAKLRDELGSTLAAHYDLLAPAVAVVDRGSAEAAGRPARRIALEKAAIVRSEPQALAQRKWREGAEVQALGGEVLLDEKTGAPLHAHLEGELAFTRDGHRYTMKLTVDHDVSAIGGKPQIAVPAAEDTVATPERLKEVDERDFLLDGMAPPAKKQQQQAPGTSTSTSTSTGTSTGATK
jgi:hypothetical protein